MHESSFLPATTPPVGDIEPALPLYAVRLDDPEAFNARLTAAFDALADDPDMRRSHFVHGRFENLYPERGLLPEIEPLIAVVEAASRRILQWADPLRIGFWFNRMEPGHVTSLHNHDEDDELLSAVYYLSVPADSGRLVFREGPVTSYIEPEPGLLLLFAPRLNHEVEMHRGQGTRLSVAFNLGPGIP